ncbi:Hexaprenyldihydroxybenzoate methyltransferase, mitochondrial [Perkinsus chesapeaki]|uniref:Hexaprenyldihydroxybenzoate methyltransferase, mitochondrial n=1 Tax=Perkinsus chesapeaki TaxID=330153 RepID=A0A7J6LBW4_PERCH|nr:Hexaprenyldihydroxybenzoate methyltransferase, mitochondrial [Perkinsus chesapeaki]
MASLYGYNITGIDISEASVQQARQHGQHLPNLHHQVGSAYEIPFEDSSFDGVIISDVLEHLLDLRLALSEIHRVLKPGGVLVFDTISRTAWSYATVWLITQEILKIMPTDAHDWRLFITPSELKTGLSDAGFVYDTDERSSWSGLVLANPIKGVFALLASGFQDPLALFSYGFVEDPHDLSAQYCDDFSMKRMAGVDSNFTNLKFIRTVRGEVK